MQELGARRKAWLAEGALIRNDIPAAARRAMIRRGVSGETVAQELGMTRQSLWALLIKSDQEWVSWFRKNVGTDRMR